MANKAYEEVVYTLQDGKDVFLRPLPIGRLRRFMDAWKKFEDVASDDDGFTVFINCAGIALEENFKGDFDALKASSEEREKGEFLSEDYKEYLEDTLDLDSIYKVLEVCGGIKLNDPKLMEAAMEAQAQLGTTSTS